MKVKALVMDVDGTLTDGKIHISNSGELFKSFNVKDGYGICNILPKLNIIPIIITGRSSKILEKRCQELNILHIYQGVDNKIEIMNKILRELEISLDETAYIGDDINDLCCMRIVGYKACPNDAVHEIKEIADFICTSNGGNGALREFINWIQEEYN